MTSIIANNVAVITGAGAGGIGFAIAKQLLQQYKLRVILLDIDEKSLQESKDELVKDKIPPTQFESMVVDVSKFDQMQEAAKTIRTKYGQIDFLLLNAGVQIPTANYKEGGDLTSWNKVLDVNLYGVINGVQAFVDSMVKQNTDASVVITGSKQGITFPPGNPAYNVSKAAVRALSDSLSYSLLDTKVKVNLLIPGYVFTKLTNPSGKTLNEKPSGAWLPNQIADYLFEHIEKDYYIVCPDNDVNPALDKARMEWSGQDIIKGRPALSRWNPEYKEEFEKFIAEKTKL